jgi:hypothetical protein
MDRPPEQEHGRPLAFCAQDDPRGALSALLLTISGLWVAGMAWGISRAEDTGRFTVLFAGLAVATLLIAYAAFSLDPAWDHRGRLLVWFVFGLMLALWMIGIFGIGWLLMPALVCNLVALVMWPRRFGRAIATREGILAEIAGFISGPFVAATVFAFG